MPWLLCFYRLYWWMLPANKVSLVLLKCVNLIYRNQNMRCYLKTWWSSDAGLGFSIGLITVLFCIRFNLHLHLWEDNVRHQNKPGQKSTNSNELWTFEQMKINCRNWVGKWFFISVFCLEKFYKIIIRTISASISTWSCSCKALIKEKLSLLGNKYDLQIRLWFDSLSCIFEVARLCNLEQVCTRMSLIRNQFGPISKLGKVYKSKSQLWGLCSDLWVLPVVPSMDASIVLNMSSSPSSLKVSKVLLFCPALSCPFTCCFIARGRSFTSRLYS